MPARSGAPHADARAGASRRRDDDAAVDVAARGPRDAVRRERLAVASRRAPGARQPASRPRRTRRGTRPASGSARSPCRSRRRGCSRTRSGRSAAGRSIVALAGPPAVNRNGSRNTWAVPMICRISVTSSTPRSCGSVMCQILCQSEAPSTSAASYSSAATPRQRGQVDDHRARRRWPRSPPARATASPSSAICSHGQRAEPEPSRGSC